MATKYYVTSVTRFDFVPEGQQNRLSGCKVNVLLPAENKDNRRGCPLGVMPAAYSVFEQFQELPGNYELETFVVPKGKSVELHVQSAKKVA